MTRRLSRIALACLAYALYLRILFDVLVTAIGNASERAADNEVMSTSRACTLPNILLINTADLFF